MYLGSVKLHNNNLDYKEAVSLKILFIAIIYDRLLKIKSNSYLTRCLKVVLDAFFWRESNVKTYKKYFQVRIAISVFSEMILLSFRVSLGLNIGS